MKKDVTLSAKIPKRMHEAFKEYAAARKTTPSKLVQGFVSDATGIPIHANENIIMTKINAIKAMVSVYPETQNEYPSIPTFYRAFQEGRVRYRDDGSVLLYSAQKSKCYCFVPVDID